MARKGSAWMPLYVADYHRDTRHLSAAEHGAYLLLLMEAWTRNGTLPSDDRQLMRIACMTPKEWTGSRTEVLAFFTLSDDGYRHGRLDKELTRAEAVISQRVEAGKASAARRWGNGSDNEKVTGAITGTERDGQRGDTPSPSHGTNVPNNADALLTRKRAKSAPVLASKPDEVDQQIWDDFQALRKKKGAPVTVTALNGITSQAIKAGISLSDALAVCCRRGWQGFEADWYLKDAGNGEYRNGSGSGARSGDGFGRALARAAAAFGPDDDG